MKKLPYMNLLVFLLFGLGGRVSGLPLPPRVEDPIPGIARPSKAVVAEEIARHHQVPQRLMMYDRPTIARLVTGQRQILLTFDDGPHPRTTPRILDILRKYRIKAIFFMLGVNVRKHPELTRRIHDEGHILANHTYYHPALTKCSAERVIKEIRDTNELIEKTTGVRPKFLRPPYGALNKAVIRQIHDEGMSIMLWNLDPSDWRHRDSSRSLAILKRQMRLDGSGKGGIVLMHDTVEATVETLEPFLAMLHKHRFNVAHLSNFGRNRRLFWTVKNPVLMHPAFSRPIHPGMLEGNILAAWIQPHEDPDLTCLQLLQAKKSGTLMQTLLCRSF